MAKAYASFKTGLPADALVDQHPYLLEPGMTRYGGSAVDPVSGLVIAFSGVQAHFDKLISQWMLATIQALCIDEMQKILATTEDFMPEPAGS